MSPDIPPAAIHVIEYDYAMKDILYHAVITDWGEKPIARWTITEDGKATQVEQPMGQVAFAYLRNDLVNSPAFKIQPTGGNGSICDALKHHTISITVQREGRSEVIVYAIPSDESNLQYQQWLSRLHVPWVKSKPKTPAVQGPADKIKIHAVYSF